MQHSSTPENSCFQIPWQFSTASQDRRQSLGMPDHTLQRHTLCVQACRQSRVMVAAFAVGSWGFQPSLRMLERPLSRADEGGQLHRDLVAAF